jgi:hypothetical protein
MVLPRVLSGGGGCRGGAGDPFSASRLSPKGRYLSESDDRWIRRGIGGGGTFDESSEASSGARAADL